VIRKIVSAREAVSRVPDNAAVAISGSNAATALLYLIETLLQHYLETGRPKNLVYNF
jgi:acyl CoA:acetate/3-ketoacid CoA transferase